MPFSKGNQLGKANLGRRKESKKTIWLMESLAEHGYNYEAMLVTFLQKAAKGDRLALDMAHLLVKLVPHLANAPKQDAGTTQIETLVINRFDSPKDQEVIDTPDIRNDAIPSEVVPDNKP
jgi:hypothetical protein